MKELSISIGTSDEKKDVNINLNSIYTMLVYGYSGCGKTSFVYYLINQYIANNTPGELKILIADSKGVDYAPYNKNGYMLLPVVVHPNEMFAILGGLVNEINKRKELFQKAGCASLEAYKDTIWSDLHPLQEVLLVIDDMSLCIIDDTSLNYLSIIIKSARTFGIRVIGVTSSVGNTGIRRDILPLFNHKVLFSSSKHDSQYLIGNYNLSYLSFLGEALYYGNGKPIKFNPINVEFDKLIKECANLNERFPRTDSDDKSLPIQIVVPKNDDEDDLYGEAVEYAAGLYTISVSMVQQRFHIGYNRAARLIDDMEARGIIGLQDGSHPRKVLITSDALEKAKIAKAIMNENVDEDNNFEILPELRSTTINPFIQKIKEEYNDL